LFLVYPNLIPPKSGPVDMGVVSGGREVDGRSRRRIREEQEVAAAEGAGEGISTASAALKAERYRPRIYGFQLNETAKLQRWQEAVRDR
jgi:casein kinase II subunit beta